MEYWWLLGVFIYVSGTVGEALGANLQRYAARMEEEKPEEERELEKQPYHRIGFWCFVLSGIFMSMALFFATTTLLAPMQLFMFMSNFIFAHYINGEPFNWGTDGVAAGCVAAGVIMCVVVAPKDSDSMDQAAMIDLMQKPTFYTYVGLSTAFIATAMYAKRKFMRDSGGDPTTLSKTRQNLLNMSWGSHAGALGGVNVTLTKVCFSIIIGEWNDDQVRGVVTSPLMYCISFFLVMTYIFQICVTVDGLEACSAIIVMSTHSVTEEVFAMLGGILWFEDYSQLTWITGPIFVSGQVLAIVAVVVLSYLRVGVEEEKSLAEMENDGSVALSKDDQPHHLEMLANGEHAEEVPSSAETSPGGKQTDDSGEIPPPEEEIKTTECALSQSPGVSPRGDAQPEGVVIDFAEDDPPPTVATESPPPPSTVPPPVKESPPPPPTVPPPVTESAPAPPTEAPRSKEF